MHPVRVLTSLVDPRPGEQRDSKAASRQSPQLAKGSVVSRRLFGGVRRARVSVISESGVRAH